MSLQECEKIYRKAESSLKTSFFSLKFSPDYISGSSYFQEAAKGYSELKYFDKSLDAFLKAIECNKKQHDSWSEAQNYEEIAKIYLLEKDDFNNGLNYLKHATYSYQVAGKALVAPRLFLELAAKLREREKMRNSMMLLQEAFNESYESAHDELIRIMLEDIYVKLLDLYCFSDQFVLACDIAEKMLKIQIDYKDKKNKITKNFSRIVMLRIIMNEEYLCQGIIDKMYAHYDASCADDIEDIKTLFQSYQTCNKQKFNSTITYSFELYETNLLKKLKATFDKRFANFNSTTSTTTQLNEKFETVEGIQPSTNFNKKEESNEDFSENWK